MYIAIGVCMCVLMSVAIDFDVYVIRIAISMICVLLAGMCCVPSMYIVGCML